MNFIFSAIRRFLGAAQPNRAYSSFSREFGLICASALCCGVAFGAPVRTGVHYAGTPIVMSTAPYSLGGPEGVLLDGNGNPYISDTFENQILKVSINGTTNYRTVLFSLGPRKCVAVDAERETCNVF